MSRASEVGNIVSDKANQATEIVVQQSEIAQKYASINSGSAIGMVNRLKETSVDTVSASTSAIKSKIEPPPIFNCIRSKRNEIKKRLEESFGTHFSDILFKMGTRSRLNLWPNCWHYIPNTIGGE